MAKLIWDFLQIKILKCDLYGANIYFWNYLNNVINQNSYCIKCVDLKCDSSDLQYKSIRPLYVPMATIYVYIYMDGVATPEPETK